MKTRAWLGGLILYVQTLLHLQGASLVATNASWKYLDNGTDQGTAWRAIAFDDSAWQSGPAELGVGDGDETTIIQIGQITTYFRRAFNVVNPASYGPLTFRLKRDDGAIVYLNGTQVYRNNMPTGAVNFVTLASSVTEDGFFFTNAAPNTLVAGLNVVAVEVHQASTNSADISFALELIGEEPLPLVMRIPNFTLDSGAYVAVDGTPGTSITIQSSDTAQAWSVLQSGTIPASGSFLLTNAFAGAGRFYRAVNEGGGGVYSVNIVGAFTLNVAPGHAMIANHLQDTNNTVALLLPSVAPGTSIYKIGADNRFAMNNYLQGWSDLAMQFRPGDGVFVRNPTASPVTLAFKGELLEGNLVNALPGGFTICSSIVPQTGRLQADLQYPAADDDIIYIHNGTGYNIYQYFGEWFPQEPTLSVGQAFWSSKAAPANWARIFVINGGGSYGNVQFAASSGIAQINFFTYNTNASKGRVFLADGSTPVSSNFFGQLYAGTNANEASLAAIGAPAQFLGNSGYIRSAGVTVPSATPNDTRSFQLRVWDSSFGTNYESAVANGGPSAKSAVFSRIIGGGLILPEDANDFASFSVGAAPSITVQPQSQTVTVGTTVSFTVTASGSTPLSFAWRRNGVTQTNQVLNTNISVYTINNVQTNHAANYTVVVTNLAGSVTSSTAVLTVLPDSDGDGLPNSWELTYGLNPNNAADAAGDLDGDGMTNLEEYRASSDPTNPSSYLAISSITRSGGQTTITFGASAGVSYAVETASSSTGPWSVLGQLAPRPTNSVWSIVDPTAAGSRYYRVGTRHPSYAPVYSVNIVGYVNQLMASGFNDVIRPSLFTPPNNSVDVMLPAPPEDTCVYVWNPGASAYDVSCYFLGFWEPALDVPPATAFKLYNPSAPFTVTFIGEVVPSTPPTITMQPQSQTVPAGTNVQFSVIANGTPPLSYQWSKNGIDLLVGANAATFTINSVGAADQGNYSVRVANAVGSTNSGNAVLTVATPPAITTQPQSQIVAAGTNVQFSVIASGTLPLSYQWRKGGVNIPGATGSTLTINFVSAADAANYSVQITNVMGSVISANAGLTVTFPDILPGQTLLGNFAAEGAFNLYAFAGSAGQTATIIMAEGVDGGFTPTVELRAPGGVTILATNWGIDAAQVRATLPTNGTYFILCKDRSGLETNFYAVSLVLYPGANTNEADGGLILSGQTKNGAMSFGDVDVYHFTGNAGERASVDFTKQVLNGFFPYVELHAPNGSVVATNLNTPTASIQSQILSQSGTHLIVVRDFNGGDTNLYTLSMTLTAPPTITTQPQSQTVVAGSNVTFSVTASPAPLGYQWFFNGSPLPGANSAALTLNSIQVADAGNYHVVVSNPSGSVTSAVATLTITQRGLIAAESFEYPTGLLAGQDGGIGFTAAYLGGGSVSPSNLVYTDTNGAALPTAGGRYLAQSDPYAPIFRDFDTSAQPSASFGTPGSIIYVGFLVKLESGTNSAGVGWGGVSLLNGALEQVFFGDPGFEGQLNWGVDRQLGSNNVRQSSIPVDFQTHLLVARIDFGFEDTTVRLYVDPPLDREPSVASVPPFATPPFRFTTLRIASSPNGFAFDEIKVGTSYDDVVQGLPECVPAPSGLMAWWRGEGNALDAVGGNHGALANGTSFAPGKVGQAFVYGGGSFFSISASNLNFSGTDPMSVELWAYRTGNEAIMHLLGKRSGCGAIQYQLAFDGAGVGFGPVSTGVQLPLNEWKHLAATYDGVTFNFYIDGQLAGSGPGSLGPALTEPLTIGDSGGCNQPFVGRLDEVSFFNRALSANEIAAIYAAGSAGKCPPQAAPPAIASLSAVSGAVGSALTINGSNFSSIASNNIVYFGTVRAVVNFATSTQLVVTVPAGAAYAPVSATVDGLAASSRLPFGVTFASTEPINSGLFAPPVTFLAAPQLGDTLRVADMDGDGRNDVVMTTRSDPAGSFTLLMLTNRALAGAFSTSSLSSAVVIDAGPGERRTHFVADVDGDGGFDVLTFRTITDAPVRAGWDLYRISTSTGGLSFARSVIWATNNTFLALVGVGDLDGDGRMDLLGATNRTFYALRNIGAPGAPAFDAPQKVFESCGVLEAGTTLADLDGDGKLDIILATAGCHPQVYRNTASPGVLSTNSFALPFNLGVPGTRSPIKAADFDVDGKLDLALLFCPGTNLTVLRNTSAPGNLNSNSFAQVTSIPVGGWHQFLDVADFDGDGRPDAATSGCVTNDFTCGGTCNSNTVSVVQNISVPGNIPTFGAPVTFGAGTLGARPNAADMDGDGRPDLVVATYTGYFSVWHNIMPPLCVTPPSGLVSWWKGEGNALDAVGSNHGTLSNGTTFAAGKVGQAFRLDGTNDFVSLGSLTQLDRGTGITVMAWIWKQSATKPAGIVGRYGNLGSTFLLYEGEGASAGKGTFTVVTEGAGGTGITGSTDLPVGQWTFVAGTWSGHNGQLSFYKNGVLEASSFESGAVGHLQPYLPHVPFPGKIGSWGDGDDQPIYKFHGLIDEVAIFNRALTAVEIGAIYAAGVSGKCPPQALQLTTEGSGRILVNPPGPIYPYGSMVTITAVSNRYRRFVRWSDGDTNSERTVTISLNNSYTAIFEDMVPLETTVLKVSEKVYGGSGDEYLPTILPTSDGGYIVSTFSDSSISGNKQTAGFGLNDVWILKLDANADKVWERTFGGDLNDDATKIIQTADGGYLVAAQSSSGATGNRTNAGFGTYDMWLFKLDASGNKLWERTYGGDAREYLLDMIPDGAGGYLLAGASQSGITGNKGATNYGDFDAWIVRIDAQGNKLWDRSYGGAAADRLFGLQTAPGGGFFLIGDSASGTDGNKTSQSLGTNDYWLIKIDSDGNKLWERVYGGTGYDFGYRLVPRGAGRFLLLGDASSPAGATKTAPHYGNQDAWIVEIDENGVRLNDYSFGGTAYDSQLALRESARDGGYYLVGFSDSPVSGTRTAPAFGSYDGWLIKTDDSLNRQWEYSLGTDGWDELTDFIELADGSLLLIGDASSSVNGNKETPGFGANDVWIVKLQTREAPVGTPMVYINGEYHPDNDVTVTNFATVQILSGFPGGSIFFTLDGSDPDQGEVYTGPVTLASDAMVRAVAYTADFQVSAEADPVLVLIARAPVILSQPQSQTVAAGEPVQFTVVASGEEPLSYQWYRGEATLHGETNSTFVISAAQVADAGIYFVTVANVHGIVFSSQTVLEIIRPPEITSHPMSFNVLPGVGVTNCVVATGDEPLRYQWRKNGVNLRGETNQCLIIPNVQVEHGGTYDVIVANAASAVVSQQGQLRLILQIITAGDHFSNRVDIAGSIGSLQATNFGAGKEPGEPNHGGKPGGSSVWYRWTAPFAGIVTFRTVGSTFDTLLAAYLGQQVANLTVVASDEDAGGFLTSLIRFSALAGQQYAIAVDGFGDTEGEFTLSWELVQRASPLPVILQQPQSQTVLLGTNVLFSVSVSNAATYLWFRNGEPLYAQAGPQLVIPSAGPVDVGTYRVAVTNSNGDGIESETAILEIARGFRPPGVRTADKIEDLSFPILPPGFNLRGGKAEIVIPVSSGLPDLQILNNSESTTSIGETNRCNTIGGASRWFQVRALANATMRIDTIGSTIDTILSVYRGTNQLSAGFGAVDGGCDDDSGPNKTSIVRFQATNGVDYSIQVDGKNGTNGTVFLNFGLGIAPSNTQVSSRQVARQGDNIVLTCTAVGSPNPAFFWYRSNQTATAAFVAVTTTGTLPLSNIQPTQQGTYTVIVSNFIASITNTVAEVVVQTNAVIAAQTGFDSSMEGWTAITNGGALDLRHSAAGGNPGGHLAVRSIPVAGFWYWIAPPSYLGNKFYCYNGSLSFELRQTITDSLVALPAEDVILEGAGQRLVINLTNPSGSLWNTYRVPLNESASWRVGNLAGPLAIRGDFLAVLTSLTNLMIRGSAGLGTELGQIDSILLLGATTPVLSIRADGADWIIEWPQALAGFTLQTIGALDSARVAQTDNWLTEVPSPVVTNSLNQIRLPSLPTQQFFRLHKP